ncbi:SMP-30/gluconolactonase/LRE family protein [Parvularcula marina]|uniref:SMP-30/gluconolactonase/LRE family protein n=1 Tax=Parvularcula marina TaxID=2292771 RepID=A0A371RGJ6_9PROT|nr:SMP-30/gluconolactonase/LRE family protein [Parvularcula marina]RFB04584.1 SMP-30/gluconolactonase/LRE family protein [Parvularcula marina]
MRRSDLIEVIDVGNELGEGVLWRASDQTVWWADILSMRLYRFNWDDHGVTSFRTPARLTAFSFVEGTDAVLLAAFDEGLAYFEPETGRTEWLDRPDALAGKGVRLNDGRTDPQGRFWVGSMVEGQNEGGELASGTLYRVDVDEKLVPVMGGIRISNGLAWSPDGSELYFADSPTGKVSRASFNKATGEPGPFADWLSIEDASPDGGMTDAEGYYWSALWGGSRVHRYSPSGELELSLKISCPQPTCVAFGGPRLDHLIITSARTELSDDVLSEHPLSGGLYIFETPFHGIESVRYKGSSWRQHWPD